MFATIVVVLLSHFTGGRAHLSHGGISKVFDSGGSSLTKTTVLAWYTDVMHEIVSFYIMASVPELSQKQKPVTSG
jgi:preprotein translocase subunit SecG